MGAVALSLLAALFCAASAHAAVLSWSVSPPSFDFGAVAMGARSTPATFILTNTGEADLPPPRVDLEFERPEDREGQESGIFEDNAFDCAVRPDLEPGESCTVTLTFQPANRGPRSGTIRFVDPGSELASATAVFSGVGLGPVVSFSPPPGLTAVVGEGPSLPPEVLTVTNKGDAGLSITGISLVGENASHFSIVGGKCQSGVIVAPGASCGIQLTYSPTTAGFLFGELQLTDNAAHGYQIADLLGNGFVPAPRRPAPLATFISQRPRKVSTRRFARFRFGVAGGHVKFACRLDRHPFRPCTSPKTYGHLALGHHAFRVRPLGQVVGASPIPAVARFRVIAKANG